MEDGKIIWHKIDEKRDDDGKVVVEAKDWHTVELHATDANHAVSVDPDHWSIEKPDGVTEVAPEPGTATETETEQQSGDPE